MSLAVLRRLRAMDRQELQVRAATALRTRVRRASTSLKTPEWRRDSLRLSGLSGLVSAREAIGRSDWHQAHRALATHFVHRPAHFPLDARHLEDLASRIRAAFPDLDPTAQADAITRGDYHLLGYRGIRAGSPPDWHRDPVHGQVAPLAFWNTVPYLDPACGDHKITWELNRHQHFLALGRAYALTRDRRYYLTFVSHLSDWISRNPPLIGTNWSSMLELAFRCLSWTWALHFFADAVTPADDQPWTVDLLLALDRQLDHVAENLSTYFSPNTHLTGEALALYVAGRALPELAGSSRRAAIGRAVLLAEAERQVLADGGHAERSTHYHRYSTDFYLLAWQVARLTSDPDAHALRVAALRQARFLRGIADDRGRVPLIGDDDGGQLFPICGRAAADCADTLGSAAVLLEEPALAVAPLSEETYWLCGSHLPVDRFEPAPVRPPSTAYTQSGYCVSRNDGGDHLVFDCGAHGYLNGGHAHADALSVTLTVGGRPLFVDPGTATYTMAPEVRDRFRGTAMHNTVEIGGRGQSEPAGPFHWRTRADATLLRWVSDAAGDLAVGRHEGYVPFDHTRTIDAVHGKGWVIRDLVAGPGTVSAVARWHVHPDWAVAELHDGEAVLRHADGARVLLRADAPLRRATDAALHQWAPEYGRIETCLCLETPFSGAAPLTLTTVIAADGSADTAQMLASRVQRQVP